MMKRIIKKLWLLLLAAALLSGLCAPAFAEGETDDALIDSQRLQEIVDALIAEHGVKGENLSIGYCYLATGDTWYYNGSTWYYAASVYKVPLMMLMAEKVSSGELTQDSLINGTALSEYERLILTYSNNDYARYLRFNYFGGDEDWVGQSKKFSSLADGEYDPNFMSYRYYSARYITDVLTTLYNEPERFPNVVSCLLEAEPDSYFRGTLEGKYDIAQKYGAYEENNGTNNNHAVGIIYTPNPIVLSVMTKNIPAYGALIGDVALKFTEYTLELDGKLDDYRQEQAAQQEQALKEQEQAQQQAAQEEQRKAQEEQQRQEQERLLLEQKAKKEQTKKWLLIGGGSLLVLAAAGAVVLKLTRRPPVKKRPVAAAPAQTRSGYRPKH